MNFNENFSNEIISETKFKKRKSLTDKFFKYFIKFITKIIFLIFLCKFTLYKLNNQKYFKNSIMNNFKSNIFPKNKQFYEEYYISKIRTSIKWPFPNQIKFKPMMTNLERIAFSYFMKKENIYFEFGSGGTTNIASFYKLRSYSVESDLTWHKKLKDNKINANFITIDLKSRKIGFPGKNTSINDWKKYIQSYHSEYNADIILIDGRFRVACGLDIFQKIRNDTIILIHDYPYRKYYHILENYYLKIKTWDSLVAFIKNPYVKKIPEYIYQKYLSIPL